MRIINAFGQEEPELVHGEIPWNNGDYAWCEPCGGWVHFDALKEVAPYTFTHRGHGIEESAQRPETD